MSSPVNHMFPDTGQFRLANQASTDVVPFVVDKSKTQWFLQVIAIGPPYGGRAPDIEIQVGGGMLTIIPQNVKVAIRDVDGFPIANASWSRDLSTDVFTVKLEIVGGSYEHWNVRITNTDPEELGFVWTSAATIEQGKKPRIQMDTTLRVATVHGAAPDQVVPVSNIGPGELTFAEPADTDMGAGFVLKSFPKSIAPNGRDHLEISVTPGDPFAASDETAAYILNCNDPADEEKTLRLARQQAKEGKESKDKEGYKEHKDFTKAEIDISVRTPFDLERRHFIPREQRPNLTDDALDNEDPDAGPSTW